jgi:hypothetical protein
MIRTTIVAPDELLEHLRLLAARRRVSLATVIREALEQKAKEYRPKPKSIGMGDSGSGDTARRVGDEPVPPVSWR